MIPEIGLFAFILSIYLSLMLFILPLWGVKTKNLYFIHFDKVLSYAVFALLSLSIVCLEYAFLSDDFSVLYVASHSNSALPFYFKMAALWGGHEGSLLFWVFCLSLWTSAVARMSALIEPQFRAIVLSILGCIIFIFGIFLLFTSSPFERILPIYPVEGRDLNPILQDVGLIFHPPLLYIGYVGFAVNFAFAIAVLIMGKVDSAWLRWSRFWALLAWSFLSAGIALGSFWAYYELGWGGWWFWDPVENASFMPWLVATALIHSLVVTEKRGIFYNWTILLSIFVFSLSLLGTFLVRSGVLTSVHAFASDPSRGLFILLILMFVIVGSLTLFALRSHCFTSVTRFDLFSKEVFMVLCNVLLLVTALSVLLGTLFPLFSDVFDIKQISVGPPYFNTFFVPLMLLLSLLMGLAPSVRWKHMRIVNMFPFLIIFVLNIIFTSSLFVFFNISFEIGAFLGVFFAIWVMCTLLYYFYNTFYDKKRGEIIWQKISMGFMGMFLAHLGFALTMMGISVVSFYEIQKSVLLGPSITEQEVAGYVFKYDKANHVVGPNYTGIQLMIDVYKDKQWLTTLLPEKRAYTVQVMSLSEVGIDWSFARDLYVSVGDKKKDNFIVRIHYKPMVRWIWFGVIFMVVGGICALLDKHLSRVMIADMKVKGEQ